MDTIECYYCNKKFSSNFLLREHISYGHKIIMDVISTKPYKELLNRVSNLENEIKNLNESVVQLFQCNTYLIQQINELKQVITQLKPLE